MCVQGPILMCFLKCLKEYVHARTTCVRTHTTSGAEDAFRKARVPLVSSTSGVWGGGGGGRRRRRRWSWSWGTQVSRVEKVPGLCIIFDIFCVYFIIVFIVFESSLILVINMFELRRLLSQPFNLSLSLSLSLSPHTHTHTYTCTYILCILMLHRLVPASTALQPESWGYRSHVSSATCSSWMLLSCALGCSYL